MIDRIRGKLLRKSVTEAIVEVGGIAFSVSIPFTTSDKLTAVGTEVQLVTYLHVKEDILALYGFNSETERNLFIQLLSVSGVGPKMGLAILSRFDPASLTEAVSSGEAKRLTTVPGIGKKKADRLMLELKDKLGVKTVYAATGGTGASSPLTEAIHALEALGFSLNHAEDNARSAQKQLGDDSSVEEIVRQALKR
jgi:holliday junction DNA helicase RuvA